MLILPPFCVRLREENLFKQVICSGMNDDQYDNRNDETEEVELDVEEEEDDTDDDDTKDSEIDPEVEQEIKKVIVEEDSPKTKAQSFSDHLIHRELGPDELFDDGSI